MIYAKMESEKIDQLFAELIEKSIDIRPALVAIEQEMMDAVEETFEQEGRPPWADLSPVTKKLRAEKGKWPGKKLQVTGQLAASIQERNHSKHIGEVTKDSVIIGTNIDYAADLQEGTSIMPARPFLEIYQETVKAAEEILADHLIGKL